VGERSFYWWGGDLTVARVEDTTSQGYLKYIAAQNKQIIERLASGKSGGGFWNMVTKFGVPVAAGALAAVALVGCGPTEKPAIVEEAPEPVPIETPGGTTEQPSDPDRPRDVVDPGNSEQGDVVSPYPVFDNGLEGHTQAEYDAVLRDAIATAEALEAEGYKVKGIYMFTAGPNDGSINPDGARVKFIDSQGNICYGGVY
jgi:hypothetical protein